MKFSIQELVLASNNQGKIAEITLSLAEQHIRIIPQSQFAIDEVQETATTFVENAILKARHATKISGLPALADDSGLVVPALGGKPGIYSARYAGTPKNDDKNNAKLLAELKGKNNRQAAFVCVMALCLSATHPLPILAEGIWQGEITETPYGGNGFGYDPVFYVPSHKVTAAQLHKAEKNRISHRGLALQSLLERLV